jgi:hypothetical protein
VPVLATRSMVAARTTIASAACCLRLLGPAMEGAGCTLLRLHDTRATGAGAATEWDCTRACVRASRQRVA